MKFLTWNIQSGGGQRISIICDFLNKSNADFISLTEYKSKSYNILKTKLIRNYKYISTSNPSDNSNGLFVASKYPFKILQSEAELDHERWLEIRIENLDLNILTVHIPGAPDNKFQNGYGISGEKRKELFWKKILDYAIKSEDSNSVILGDFNTGLRMDAEGAMFKHSGYMEMLLNYGFTDVWRSLNKSERDYTYYSKRKDKATNISYEHNGFRLDYIFVSPNLKSKIINSQILHEPRKLKLSDHAVVTTELNVPTSKKMQDININKNDEYLPFNSFIDSFKKIIRTAKK